MLTKLSENINYVDYIHQDLESASCSAFIVFWTIEQQKASFFISNQCQIDSYNLVLIGYFVFLYTK